MKRVVLLVIGLLLFSISSFAGEYFANETMKVVYGLQVVFSEPVTITGFGDLLMVVEPAGEATEFIFSGGEVGSWEGQWFSWEPVTAVVTRHKWLAEGDSLSNTPLDAVAQDFIYEIPIAALGIALTIDRHVQRNQLPFEVHYEIANPESLDGHLLAWDVDKYVDSDGDGNAQNDRDAEGATLDLIYVENYNPTISLLISNSGGDLLASWENMVRNDFTAGATVALDGRKLLEMHELPPSQDASLTWQQLHMEQNSLEYMTEYIASVQNPRSSTTTFTPQYAGRYVYALEAASAGEVQVLQVAGWVVETPSGSASRVGILMQDIWNGWIDDEGTMIEGMWSWFRDEEAVEKLRYLSEAGFENISMGSCSVLERTSPVPFLTSEEVNVPSDDDLRWVFSEIETPDLRVGSYYSLMADPEWGDSDDWVQFDNLPLSYYESYFQQYHERVMELAALAEDVGAASINVGANHPYLWGIGGIDLANHEAGRFVADQWVEMISDVREVFSGDVGITAIHPDTPAARPLVGIPDFVEYLTGSYCYWGDCGHAERIAATRTAEDLRLALAAFYRDAVEPISRDIGCPIVFQVAPASFLGAARVYYSRDHEQSGYDAWRPEFAFGGYEDEIINGDALAPFQPSFRDQSLLLETFLPVLSSMQSVDSITLWGDAWELMDFENFLPKDVIELVTVNSMTLQGKPGFQVARLWASILDPNERLLYRRVLPFAKDEGPLIVGEVEKLSESLDFDWDAAPFQISLPEDFRPTEYWSAGVLYPITDPQHWDLPGYDVRSVRLQFASDVLGVYLDSYTTDLLNSSRFTYQMRFLAPDDSVTLFVEIEPVQERVTIALWDGEKSPGIPVAAIGYKISDDSILLLIPNLELSSTYSILDIADWRIEMSLVFAMPDREEIYNLFSSDSYNNVLSGLTNESAMESSTASTVQTEMGASVSDEHDGVTTFPLGSSPHGVVAYGDYLLIVDIAGDIYSLDPLNGAYTRYQVGKHGLIDGALYQDQYYVCQEDGILFRLDASNLYVSTSLADLTTGANQGLVAMGIETLDETLYGLLLDENTASYYLCTYDPNSGLLQAKTPITSSSTLGELVTLTAYDGKLYTLDWMNSRIYTITLGEQGEYALEKPFDVADYVPPSLWAGGARGFSWSPWGWVLTTLGTSDTPGGVHIVELVTSSD